MRTIQPKYFTNAFVQVYNTPWASLVAQTVKNLPAMKKTQVRSVGQEDP